MIAPVEIKVNVASPVTDSLVALDLLDSPPLWRDMWFAEARARDDVGALPLLAGRHTIRLRSGDRDDVTVGVRPCDTDRLVGRWRAPFEETHFSYRLERDWCGERREVAAAAISRRPPGSVATALRDGADPAHILDAAQRQFVVTCTPRGIPIDHLGTLGPVTCQTWPEVDLDGCSVQVERWSVADVDLLELALRLQPHPGETAAQFEVRAMSAHRAIRATVTRRALSIADFRESKTHRVMTALRATS